MSQCVELLRISGTDNGADASVRVTSVLPRRVEETMRAPLRVLAQNLGEVDVEVTAGMPVAEMTQ